MTTPEARARQNIDALLTACGWAVQDRAAMNLYAGRGVAVREFPLQTGYADYLLFVDRKAAGVLEAKAEGIPLAGVAEQAGGYAVGLPANILHVELPLGHGGCDAPCPRADDLRPGLRHRRLPVGGA